MPLPRRISQYKPLVDLTTDAPSRTDTAFLILDKLSSILHQGQLVFQTASAQFASQPLAIPTATAPVRRSAARVSNLDPFGSRSARVQLAFLPSSRFILLVVRFQQSTKTKGKFEF
ncbi:hypothetical protein F2Q70_00027764 [Brassica cretica]|uniref:Uncharacterized protein n=1 Tax=Brassica cretica TaxID=69181 RepID=A0A8S9LBK3_BRACR|nr:hypothetical protein F2Q70_00027764 [Brassica cretica]